MAVPVPPPPVNEPPGSVAWQQWWSALASQYSVSGLIPWIDVSKSGANITDIPIRTHNSLQSISGGAANDYQHLTTAQYTALTNGLSVTITTAKLTGGGANGSMTFTDGILTAQTQAT